MSESVNVDESVCVCLSVCGWVGILSVCVFEWGCLSVCPYVCVCVCAHALCVSVCVCVHMCMCCGMRALQACFGAADSIS